MEQFLFILCGSFLSTALMLRVFQKSNGYIYAVIMALCGSVLIGLISALLY